MRGSRGRRRDKYERPPMPIPLKHRTAGGDPHARPPARARRHECRGSAPHARCACPSSTSDPDTRQYCRCCARWRSRAAALSRRPLDRLARQRRSRTGRTRQAERTCPPLRVAAARRGAHRGPTRGSRPSVPTATTWPAQPAHAGGGARAGAAPRTPHRPGLAPPRTGERARPRRRRRANRPKHRRHPEERAKTRPPPPPKRRR
jgi:hypothetical protein